ncbi:MAG: thiamine phosphate synthase [Acidobacteria bacterium]|uniref:Thiamine phosphate synthase n=1 Tax=Candidatus Polarisedimenticola svalbardensis TaxID=2886004 RepID=A0A8J6Y6I1_9BACT|nr:thiamine phosphate synthase [Candidatus Polarisedimenticola svalbardensis]
MTSLPRLMLVSDRRRLGGRLWPDILVEALTAGVAVVQIREKDLSDEAVEGWIVRLREHSDKENLVIVNGRPEVASRTGAGLHLPADQTALFDARPACTILGCSVHSSAEVAAARRLEPDYLVAGTVFSTRSKPGTEGCGLAGLERLTADAPGIPVYAIGGMEPEQVRAVIGAGAYGVAVSGSILGADDPARVAGRFQKALYEQGTLSG